MSRGNKKIFIFFKFSRPWNITFVPKINRIKKIIIFAKNLPKRSVIRFGSTNDGNAKINIKIIAKYRNKLNINDFTNCINF